MRYAVVFDPVQGLYAIWPPLLIFTLFLVVGVVLVVTTRATPRAKRRRGSLGFAYSWTAFACLLISTILVSSCVSYLRVRARLKAGEFVAVQGTIEDFELIVSSSGERDASFEVSGHAYHYGDSEDTPWFRNVSEPRIRDGAIVRIADIDGHIARLEVADTATEVGSQTQPFDGATGPLTVSRTPTWIDRYMWALMLPFAWAMCLFLYRRGEVAALPASRRAAAVNALVWKARVLDLPWIVMGAGILSGDVDSVLAYLGPTPKLSVFAFRFCIVTIYAVVGLWLWRTRCQVVIDVCGKLHPLFERPRTIGIVYALLVLSAIGAPLMALGIVGDLR